MEMKKTPTHHLARLIHDELKVVTDHAKNLKERLLEMARAAEEHAPMPVLMVHRAHASQQI